MEIKHVIFAENVIPAKNGQKPTVQGVLPGYIVLPFTPTRERAITYSFHVVIVGILKDGPNISIPVVHVEVLNPDGVVMAAGDSDPKDSVQFGIARNQDHLASAFMVMDMRNFPFTELGEYQFNFTFEQRTESYGLIATVVVNDANTDD